jgi:hypothetical protein
MKILRSVNRRDPNIGTAGWFTVLRATKWIAASRLSDAARHFSGQSKSARNQALEGRGPMPVAASAHSQETAPSWQAIELSAHDRSPMRLALAALSAIAITSGLLWWMIQKQ